MLVSSWGESVEPAGTKLEFNEQQGQYFET